MNHLKANGLKDYCNFFLHFGLITATATTAFVTLGSPALLGAAAIGITLLNQRRLPGIKKDMQDAIDEEKSESEKIKDVPNTYLHKDGDMGLEPYPGYAIHKKVESWVAKFAQKFGLARTPQVTIMPESKPDDDARIDMTTDRGAIRKILLRQFNKKANAFAFSSDKDNVVLTSPIVEGLSPRELKGVAAHEVAHIAAEHVKGREKMMLVSNTGKTLTKLNVLLNAVVSFKNAGLYLGAGIVATAATAFYRYHKNLSMMNIEHLPKIMNFHNYVFNGALAGLATIFAAPELLIAQGIHFINQKANHLIFQRNSRCNEFQADRVAAEVTGDPEALGSALKELRRQRIRMEPGFNFNKAKDPDNRTWLGYAFDRVRDITRTHPNVDRRVMRLEEMQAAPA